MNQMQRSIFIMSTTSVYNECDVYVYRTRWKYAHDPTATELFVQMLMNVIEQLSLCRMAFFIHCED